MKQRLTEGERDKSRITVEDLAPLSGSDETHRPKQTKKIRRPTEALNNIVNQFDLFSIYRTLSLRADYTYFFKCIQLLTKIDIGWVIK